ncbi:MAG: carboxypeptidase-like regulatory domain-containing protein [Terracidiphilus sp.]|jgi:hypothetical protein
MATVFKQRGSMRRILLLFVLLAVVCVPVCSQAGRASSATTRKPYPGNAGYVISGTVVNAITGELVRHATVAALSEEDSHIVATIGSSEEGKFTLEGLAAAKYQLTASKRGFRTAFYDEHEEFSTAIVTGAGQETGGLVFRLMPEATLRGVVTTEGGDPVEGANVMLFRKPRANEPGGRITHMNDISTDDTGAYEFNGLAAGEYLLAVKADPWYALHRGGNRSTAISIDGSVDARNGNAALDVAYPVTFFDGTTEEATATAITLAGGSREEANITLHPVPALHLSVETPHKQDGSIVRAELRQTIFGTGVPGGPGEAPGEFTQFVGENQSGTTEFTGVAPGHYELTQGDPPRIAELDATTSQLVDPTLGTPDVTVSGVLRSGSGSPLPEQILLQLTPLDGAHQAISASSIRGAFKFPAIPQGTWELTLSSTVTIRDSDEGSRGVQFPIASIAISNRAHPGNQIAVGDRPLSLVVTANEIATRIEGFARKGSKSVAGVMVLLVPKDLTSLESLARRDQSDSDGSFSLRDVVPGQYTVVAIEGGWELDWARPAVIARYLPGGIPVTVTGSSGKVLNLSVPVPVESR